LTESGTRDGTASSPWEYSGIQDQQERWTFGGGANLSR
jgi:hypothetical protein